MARIGLPDEYVEFTRGNPSSQLHVALVSRGLRADVEVGDDKDFYSGGDGESLIAYFENIEEQWRGWEGETSFRSIGVQLSLTSLHVGNAVRVMAELRDDPALFDPTWTARLVVHIEPGQELSVFIAALAHEMRGSPST